MFSYWENIIIVLFCHDQSVVSILLRHFHVSACIYSFKLIYNNLYTCINLIQTYHQIYHILFFVDLARYVAYVWGWHPPLNPIWKASKDWPIVSPAVKYSIAVSQNSSISIWITRQTEGMVGSSTPLPKFELHGSSNSLTLQSVFGSYLWNRCTSWALPSILLLSSASCCSDRQRLFSSWT